VVDEFRTDQPGDQTLIELTSWASLAAARRVGSWMVELPAAPDQPRAWPRSGLAEV
jgi:hypothetical protein